MTVAEGSISAEQAARLVGALRVARDNSAMKAKHWADADESKAQEYRTQARAYATAIGGLALAQRGELT